MSNSNKTTASSSSSDNNNNYVLVVGATGATGRFVVQMLLEKGRMVKVIVRSQSKMMDLLLTEDTTTAAAANDYVTKGQLVIKETPSLLDLPVDELTSFVEDCDAIVQCLGHNLTYHGMYKDGYFVSDSVERLTTVMPDNNKCKFILMGSDGVFHPDGTTDPAMTFGERCVYFLLRYLVPPHVDNERAAMYLYEKCSTTTKDWVVVRPTNLIDDTNDTVDDSKYELFPSQQTSPIFGNREVSRANVAHFMTRLVTDKGLYDTYNHTMPVIYNVIPKQQKDDGQSKKDK